MTRWIRRGGGTAPRDPGRRQLIVGGVAAAAGAAATGLLAGRDLVGSEGKGPDPSSTATANVLIAVLDDARRDLVQQMPNLRHLAESGVTFTRAYSETPVCLSARANLLVGQSAARTQIIDWIGRDLQAAIRSGTWSYDSSFATWIDRRSLAVGKYLNTRDPLDPAGWHRFSQPQDPHAHTITEVNHGSGFEPIAPTWHTDWELAEISRHIDQGEGWLVYWCSNSPHWPYGTKSADEDRWSGELQPIRYEQDGIDWPPWIAALPRLSDDEWLRADIARRGTVSEAVEWDRAFGTVLSSIDLDDTLVIVTSDNGLHLGDHRISGESAKNTLYEPASGVPLIVAGPRFPHGVVSDLVVSLLDVPPTVTAAVGAHAPHPLDGTDLSRIVNDPDAHRDRRLLGRRKPQANDFPPCDWIVTATRKMGRHAVGSSFVYEMYDLDADPDELNNVANSSQRLDERKALEADLDQLLGLR